MRDGRHMALVPRHIKVNSMQSMREIRGRPVLLYVDGQQVTRNAISSWLKRAQRMLQVVAVDPADLASEISPEHLGAQLLVVNMGADARGWPPFVSCMLERFAGVPAVLLANEATADRVERAWR